MNQISTTVGFNNTTDLEGGLLDSVISKKSELTLNEKIETATDRRTDLITSAINFRLNEFNQIKEEINRINGELGLINTAETIKIDTSDIELNQIVADNESIVGMILRAAAPTGGSHVQHAYQISPVQLLIDRATQQQSLNKLSSPYSDALAVLPNIGPFGTQGGDFDGDSYQILLRYHDTYQKFLKTKQQVKNLETSISNITDQSYKSELQKQLRDAQNELTADREAVRADLAESARIQNDWVKRTDNQVRRHVASYTGLPLEMLLDDSLFTQEQVSTMIQVQRGINKDLGDLSANKSKELFDHFKKIYNMSGITTQTLSNSTPSAIRDTLIATIKDDKSATKDQKKLNEKLLARINANYFEEAFTTPISKKVLFEKVQEELATIETVQHAYASQTNTIQAAAGTILDDQTYEGLQSFIGELGTTLIGKGYNALIPLMSRGANMRAFSDMLGSQANIGIVGMGLGGRQSKAQLDYLNNMYTDDIDAELTSLDRVLHEVRGKEYQEPTPGKTSELLDMARAHTTSKSQKITGALGVLQQIIRDSIKLKPSTSGKSSLISLLLEPQNKNLTNKEINDAQQAVNYRDFLSTADITGTDLDAKATLNAFGAILLLADYTDARGMATQFTGNGAYVYNNDVFNNQLGFSKTEIESSKRFSIFREKESYFLALAEGKGIEYRKQREEDTLSKYESELIHEKLYEVGKYSQKKKDERDELRKGELLTQDELFEIKETAKRLTTKDLSFYDIEEQMLMREYGLTAEQFGKGLLKEKQDNLGTEGFSFREELVANTIAEMLNRATAMENVGKIIGIEGQQKQTRAQLEYLSNIFGVNDEEGVIRKDKYQTLYDAYQQAYGDEYIQASKIALKNTIDLSKVGKLDTMTEKQMEQELTMFLFVQNQFQGITGQDIKYLGNTATSKRRMLNMDYGVQSAYSPFMKTSGEAFVAYQGLIRRGQLLDSPEHLANLNEKIGLDMARSLYETGKRVNTLRKLRSGGKSEKITVEHLQQAMTFAADAVDMMGLKTKDLLGTDLADYVEGKKEKSPSINQVKQDRTDTFLDYLLETAEGTEGTRLQQMAARQAGIYQVAEYNKTISTLKRRILQIDHESPDDVFLQSKKEEYLRTQQRYEAEVAGYNTAYKDLLESRQASIDAEGDEKLISEAEIRRQNAMNLVMKAIQDMGTRTLIENEATHNYLSDDTSYLNTREFIDQQKIIRQTKINQTMNILAAPLLSGILASGMALSDYGLMTGYDVLQGYAGFKTDKNFMGKLAGDALATQEYDKFSRMSAGFAKQRMRDQLAAEGTTGLVTGVGFEMASRGIAAIAATGVTRVMGSIGGGAGGGVGGVVTEVLSDVAASSVYTVSQVVARDKAGTSRMLGRPVEAYMPTANLIETLSNTADIASYLTEGLLEMMQEEGGETTIDSEVSFDVSPDYDIMSMYAYLGTIDMDVINDQANHDSGSPYGDVQYVMEMYSNTTA